MELPVQDPRQGSTFLASQAFHSGWDGAIISPYSHREPCRVTTETRVVAKPPPSLSRLSKLLEQTAQTIFQDVLIRTLASAIEPALKFADSELWPPNSHARFSSTAIPFSANQVSHLAKSAGAIANAR